MIIDSTSYALTKKIWHILLGVKDVTRKVIGSRLDPSLDNRIVSMLAQSELSNINVKAWSSDCFCIRATLALPHAAYEARQNMRCDSATC